MKPNHKKIYKLKIFLFQQAISEYRQIKNKTDDDVSEISYCHYNIAIIYRTYLNNGVKEKYNFQCAIDYFLSMQCLEHEDIELLKDYHWQLDNINSSYDTIAKKEQNSLLGNTANQQN